MYHLRSSHASGTIVLVGCYFCALFRQLQKERMI
nr:MAG TPA: hypothetical protein [Caudoviricetes sp.]